MRLARAERTPADEARFTVLKAATAGAILNRTADEVVEVERD